MQLGIKAKDKITGFEGVVTGVCKYISGCNQALLTPPVKDGAYVEPHWFDVQRVEALEGVPVVLDNSETPGFDKAAPKR